MNVTTSGLTKAAGAAAAVAGALFIGIQVKHPHLDATSIQTTEVVVRDTLKVLMAALALAGITGMYLSQVRRNGVLGLVGYLVLSAGYLLILGTAFTAAFILPEIAGRPDVRQRPHRRDQRPRPQRRHRRDGRRQPVQGIAYLAGGLLFGIALFRARVLARWATLLLAVGGVVTVVTHGAARRLLPAAGLPQRHRDDRSRCLALAQPAPGAPTAPSTAQAEPSPVR